jgi:site-specific DNA-methyltransferase (adenine-specific)
MEDIKLIKGDSFEILQNIPSGSIDLIVCDPPYFLETTGGGGSVNTIKKLDASLKDLKKNQDITEGYDIDAFADIVDRLQGGNINAYFWCNKAQIPDYFRAYVDRLGCKFDILTWHKVNALPTYSNKYLSDTEYCLYFHKGKGKTSPQSYDDAKTYWFEPINHKDKKLYGHPTIKPLHMIERLIRNSSKEGDVVLDCFMGSGTTGVACYNLNRKFIGIEIDDNYYNIAKSRLDEAKATQTLF